MGAAVHYTGLHSRCVHRFAVKRLPSQHHPLSATGHYVAGQCAQWLVFVDCVGLDKLLLWLQRAVWAAVAAHTIIKVCCVVQRVIAARLGGLLVRGHVAIIPARQAHSHRALEPTTGVGVLARWPLWHGFDQ